MGHCREFSDAQIFKGKYSVEEFEPDPEALENERELTPFALHTLFRLGRLRIEDEPRSLWNGPYFGADWGFSVDPTALIKCWVKEKSLYIEHEAYGVGYDFDRLPGLFDQVPGASQHVISADNSRPEIISHMQKNGFPKITRCAKWPGCVLDGVSYMRSFERIIIHPRCKHAIEEFRLYSFKTDRLTRTVLADVEDKHNHCIDAIRYAIERFVRRRGSSCVPLHV